MTEAINLPNAMLSKPLRVLFVSHQGKRTGGADESLLTLVTRLNRDMIDPLVLVPRDDSLTEALRQHHIPYLIGHYRGWYGKHPMHFKNLHHVAYRTGVNWRGYLTIRRALHAQTIDLIYTNSLFSPIGALLARWQGVPHIWHAREFVHEDFNGAYDFGTRLSMKFVDSTTALVVCNSHALKRKLQRFLPNEKLVVVYNGFPELDSPAPESNTRLQASPEKLRLAIVGRLSPGKGQIDAIRASAELLKRGMNVELCVVGSGDQRYLQALRDTVHELEMSEHVVWTGYIDNPQPIYETSDMILVCSQCEAFGRVAVEALAAGCPVIATGSGGLPEIVQDGYNGLLYPYGDYHGLARQIERLAKDEMLYHTLAHNAAPSVYGRFGVEQYVSPIQQLIVDTYTTYHQNRGKKTSG